MQELEKILEEIDRRENQLEERQIKFAKDGTGIDLVIGYRLSEIRKIKYIIRKHMNDGWIPVDDRLPEDDRYIFLSIENFTLPMIGRYEQDSEGGAFYIGDERESCISQYLRVNAWRPIPEPYRAERSEE